MIASNQKKRVIRKILPPTLAVRFLSISPYLFRPNEPIANLRINDLFNGDTELIKQVKNIYARLEEVEYQDVQRVSRSKTVSGVRSLLNYLTDGESHLVIYPEINFNQ